MRDTAEMVAQPAEVALIRQRRSVKARNLGRLRYSRRRFSFIQGVARDMRDTAETVAQPAEVALIRQRRSGKAQPRQVALLSPAIFIYSRCRSRHVRHRRNGSATCRGCADPAKGEV